MLPMLEGAFKCSSLHEMSKEFEVYEQYCEVLLTIGRQSKLRNLMLQLPPQYKPVQLESLASILKKQEANTILFKNFAQSVEPQAGRGRGAAALHRAGQPHPGDHSRRSRRCTRSSSTRAATTSTRTSPTPTSPPSRSCP
jgi:hypothetical protein